jgi:hypothetical protein
MPALHALIQATLATFTMKFFLQIPLGVLLLHSTFAPLPQK